MGKQKKKRKNLRLNALKTFKNPDFSLIIFQGSKMLSANTVRNGYNKKTEERKFAVLAEKKSQ